MAEAVATYSLEGFWAQIDQQYLLYLIADDRASKKQEREKLDYFIKEFLSFVPHDKKYIFPQTAQIIRRSASIKPDFDPIRASSAWDAIARYAINLVMQPWRKEFQEIKLYCGYYKHEIDECLVNPEIMFELMGFCNIGNSTMTITDILDPDKITSVSRDSFIASVECKILKDIWENVTPYYHFPWTEILEYREKHTGTAEQAIKTLKFYRRQRLYEEELFRRAQEEAAKAPPDLVHGSNPGQLNEILYIEADPSPPQPGQASPSEEQAEDLHPPAETQEDSQVKEEPLSDPYVDHPNNRSSDSDQSSIPTGQLIRLDSTQFQVHEPPKEYLENDDRASTSGPEKQQKAETTANTAKRGGSNVWPAWGHVYNSCKTADTGTNTSGSIQDLDELVVELEKASMNKGEKRRPKGTGVVRDTPRPSRITYNKENLNEIEIYVEENPKPKSRFAFDDEYEEYDDDDSVTRKWQCITCTFLNSKDRSICEMCFKSKEPGSECKPRPKKGIVCKKCTLINEKDNHFCDACGKRLTYTAIYI